MEKQARESLTIILFTQTEGPEVSGWKEGIT